MGPTVPLDLEFSINYMLATSRAALFSPRAMGDGKRGQYAVWPWAFQLLLPWFNS